jgi:hypothetical protein
MLCVLMIHIVMDIFEIMLSMFDYLLYVIIIMLIYGIKMVRKMTIFLTNYSRGFACKVFVSIWSPAAVHSHYRRRAEPWGTAAMVHR